MKGRSGRGRGGNLADLMTCFPTRAHVALMPKPRPKPICGPRSANEAASSHHSTRPMSRAQANPLFKAKTKPKDKPDASHISEPSSPKVTCVGQIKVRHKPTSKKNWHAVMAEIEGIHRRPNTNKPTWADCLGLKKDVLHFFTTFGFDFRCFGSFNGTVLSSDSEEENFEYGTNSFEETEQKFSKLLVVLKENELNGPGEGDEEERLGPFEEPKSPPSNALVLMRCKSAPPNAWLEKQKERDEEKEITDAKNIVEQERMKEKLILKGYAPDLFSISPEIVQETWVVASDFYTRSRSWKV